ncbi:NAD P-binding protein [Gloeophyllum trabeum ATCC 11539]|uniref:NAD P-binding protein n=1 Tax=Gloeophyllum trabeum (strain ATCC 11539 / FP-39264 / Madison 617) TaxID=670483 RepID=S7RFZ1_GLOTA|nr:NAD P-binding protein [Gloeophyllum trabeum ATCC 11539]EPQ53125.1 NAD P-binding protein [Gloeophyllum trabeum ATCC 11539]
MTPIRVGFVGLSQSGWASYTLAPPLLQPPLSASYVLTAISTSNPTSASASAGNYSKLTGRTIKAYHGPTTGIANDEVVDMVAVAVRAPYHKETALPVIQAGKDLFIEWPAGRTLAETKELAEAAKCRGVRTLVGSQARQSGLIRELKGVIDSGKIGRVLSTTVTARPHRELFAWGPYISEGAKYTASIGEGATMLDIAVGHFLDGLLYLLGPFSSISAVLENQFPTTQIVDSTGKPTGETIPQTAANQVMIIGTLERGAVVSMHWRGGLETRGGKAGTPFMWTIDGEKGSIRVESDEPSGSFVHVRTPASYFLNGEEVKVKVKDGLSNSARAWAEFAKGPDGDYSTLDDAVRTKTLLDAATRSAAEGKRIDL